MLYSTYIKCYGLNVSKQNKLVKIFTIEIEYKILFECDKLIIRKLKSLTNETFLYASLLIYIAH